MHRHHKAAIITIVATLGLDAVLGLAFAAAEHISAWHGLYCALGNGVTVGCDISPTRMGGYIVNFAEFITVVPLFAATFSLFTSGLTSTDVRRHIGRNKNGPE